MKHDRTPKHFLERETPLPAHLLLIEEMPVPEFSQRFCKSRAARAESYLCHTFYKRISRPLPLDSKEDDNALGRAMHGACGAPALSGESSSSLTSAGSRPASGEVFKLYANCLPVRGARRSIICDLQNARGQFIPNDLYAILTGPEPLVLADIKARYNGAQDKTIEEYFTLLVEQEYGFWCDEPELFPQLDLTWDRPGILTNAIIEIDGASKHDYTRIFSELDDLGCQAVQVRAYDSLSISEMQQILKACVDCRLRHLEFVVKFDSELTDVALLDLCSRHPVISRVTVHSSPRDSKIDTGRIPIVIRFHRAALTPTSCGEVAPGYFSVTVDHFTEALQFNTCLNRKISICADGEIKACPAFSHSCGNTASVSLEAAARDPVLVQLGGITKDQVAVCCDCEFRYICTDCRAFTAEAGDLYSKPAKCSYDPYTATWG